MYEPSPVLEQRASFEERLDTAIDEAAPSILDEQPAFLEDIRPAQRSPRAYGSPAARKFASSRLVRSPTSKLRGPSQLGSRLPTMARSRSELAALGEPPLSPTSMDSQQRSNSGSSQITAAAAAPRVHGGRQQFPGNDSDPRKYAATEAAPAAAALGSAISPADSGSARAAGTDSDDVFGFASAEDTDIGALVTPLVELSIADVDALVKQHRAEIRTTTEACREETLLITAYATLSYAQLAQQTKSRDRGESGRARASSWQQQTQGLADKYHLDLDTGVVTRLADGEQFDSVEKAKMCEALEYLEKLDGVLARKQQVITDLRDSLHQLLWSAQGPQ
ncbi:hypothetical protein IWQ56_005144 [Coemansia nantahalensis]|uniref:Uncharacterized protein n=1 Tax=Coemansia nantahalensis TaxID=2789366 RepID=A0ACC1JXX1_9FUNG|nr:hypothetical protein IWQ56_005144 [Coemansia nantahalensis]KAJ2769472.1 hypothetical protein IWQ57_003088 [Coemansia nantahalensis]